MSNSDTTQNVQNQNTDNEELYRIECYVETVSSDGNVTVRGVDGYRLEKKEGEKEKTYNVFWKVKPEDAESDGTGEVLVKIFPVEKNLSLEENSKELQFFLTAKANHLKVSLDVALGNADEKDKVLIQTVSLI